MMGVESQGALKLIVWDYAQTFSKTGERKAKTKPRLLIPKDPI